MDENVKESIHDLVFDFYLGDNLTSANTLSRIDLILQSVFCYCSKGSSKMSYDQCEYALLLLDKEPTNQIMSKLFGGEKEIDMETFVARINTIDKSISKLEVPMGFDSMANLTLESLLSGEADLSFLKSNLVTRSSNTNNSHEASGTVGDLLESLDKGGHVK